jgi:hypothetical protein
MGGLQILEAKLSGLHSPSTSNKSLVERTTKKEPVLDLAQDIPLRLSVTVEMRICRAHEEFYFYLFTLTANGF